MSGSSRRICWASTPALLLATLLVGHVCAFAGEGHAAAGHDPPHGNAAEPRDHNPVMHAASCYGIVRPLVADIGLEVILVEVAPTTQAAWAPPRVLSSSREGIGPPVEGPPLFLLYRAVLI
jgi:hypothetical protein